MLAKKSDQERQQQFVASRMNGATGRLVPMTVTVEDEPEHGDPPERPCPPSPEQQSFAGPTERLTSPAAENASHAVPAHSLAPEIIDVDTPASDEPEYMAQLQYTNSLIRQATMPILPPDLDDFGIPPSPPGSPDPNLTVKLDNFRQLRNRGIYFNDRLASNKSFRNPKLLDKLRRYVGIDDEYGTNLPSSVWDPHKFTRDQYYDAIAEKQRSEFEALQERQRAEQRTSIEFTSATGKSAAERILEGVHSRPASRPHSRTGSDSDRAKARERYRDDRRGDERREPPPRSRDSSPRDREIGDRGYRHGGERYRDRDGRNRNYDRR